MADPFGPIPPDVPQGLRFWLQKVGKTLAGRVAAPSADAAASTVAPSATYTQSQAVQVVTDLNAAIASLNDLKAKLRSAGLLSS